MTDLPDSYVDSMPCDPDLLVELGRVNWAAARLHAGVRDRINHFNGAPSDQTFSLTLGTALTRLFELAAQAGDQEIVDWVVDHGRPAKNARNAVAHAVTYTAEDGKQAIMDIKTHQRFQNPELRAVTKQVVDASMRLPARTAAP